ncbi:MAG: Lrp/AsnC family transcriptional regulator [Candidatus Micrarchaeota archaeon]|nr:Lrp/AsnC family transcriptional regulator [Candidatus Micrarchaeota archaeon]
MDEVDEQLIYLLRKNPKATLRELARILNKPLSTVHARIKRLKEKGIIRDASIEINWKALGYEVLAFVILWLEKDKVKPEEALRFLKSFGFVEDGYVLLSKGDVVLKIRAKNMEELYELTSKLKAMPYVKNLDIVLAKEV